MAWLSGAEYLDSLVRSYLSFRGFTNALKTFDFDLKIDKDKGFRVDKIIQLIVSFINNYDIEALKSYWSHLESRFFSRFAKSHESTIKKFEINIYRLYVVRAVQNSKPKVLEFFEKMTQDLQNQPEWKDWFAIPFIANPESNPMFSLYFSRNWADTFFVSLHNFLAALFMCMPEPELVSAVYDDGHQIMKLEKENSSLKKKLKERSEKVFSQEHSSSSSETDLRQDSNSSPASQSVPNYVKAMGVPGSLAESVPTVTQPKKNPLFGFVTRQTSTSPKTTLPSQLVKQTSQDNGLVSSTVATSSVGKVITKKTSMKESKSKELSELEAQRRELFGSTKKNVKSSASSAANFSNVQKSNSKQSLLEDSGNPRTQVPKINQQSIKTSTGMKEMSSKGSSDKLPNAASAVALDNTRSPNEAILQDNNTSTSQPHTNMATPSTVSAVEEFEASYDFVNTLHKMVTADKPGVSRNTDTGFVDSILITNNVENHDNVEVLYDEKPFLVLSKDVFLEHHSGISQCRFDAIGTTIASIDTQGVVKVWKNEPRISTLATVMFQSPIQCLEWCSKPDNMLLLGTANGSIQFFNTTVNQSKQNITVDEAYPWVTGIATHPSGSAFVCSCVRPSADSNKYLSASNQGILQIWSLRGGQEKLIHCLKGRGSSCEITCMEYNHNGNLLVAGDYQGRITLYDMKTHESLHSWDAHHGPVGCLQFSSDETLLFSLGSDCQFLAWSIHQLSQQAMKFTVKPMINGTGATLHALDRTLPKGRLFSFDPEGKHVLMSVGNKGTVYKVNSSKQTLTQVLSLPEHKSPVTAVDWTSSKTCGHCLTGSSDGKVQVTTLLTQ